MNMKAQNLIIIPVLIICLALLCAMAAPKAFAVVPAPDGGYPGGNTAEGQNALLSLTSGTYNTAVGVFSLRSNAEGNFNTAIGAGTLLLNTADGNTATGAAALLSNTTGTRNTANGAFPLFSNTIGNSNTAIGYRGLFSNTVGSFNTATGFQALIANTTGAYNTANGGGALGFNTEGSRNTANGFYALQFNQTGNNNTANGDEALFFNSTGDQNTANGTLALLNNTTGIGNVALGNGAGFNATTGNLNVYIGAGMVGVAGESNACYISSIFGQTSANGIPVLINSDNKLGTTTSSKRFKEDIKPMDQASDTLFALKPVTFRYKKELDSAGRSQFGLVAEEVAEVNADLVVRDEKGEIYSVRYDQVNAMLLNEFLKEHRKVAKLEATVAQQEGEFQSKLAQQGKQIAALTAGLQEISARVELNRPAARFADNISH
jgi:hypothetical protein